MFQVGCTRSLTNRGGVSFWTQEMQLLGWLRILEVACKSNWMRRTFCPLYRFKTATDGAYVHPNFEAISSHLDTARRTLVPHCDLPD